jgi:hypothetical protein
MMIAMLFPTMAIRVQTPGDLPRYTETRICTNMRYFYVLRKQRDNNTNTRHTQHRGFWYVYAPPWFYFIYKTTVTKTAAMHYAGGDY